MTSEITLYAITDNLPALLDTLEMTAEGSQERSEIESEIQRYMEALPDKIDAVAHVLAHLDSQAEMGRKEVERLRQRVLRFEGAAIQLRKYACSALERLPEPRKGPRKLEGAHATLILRGNGGPAPLKITDESMIPEECCEYRGRVAGPLWLRTVRQAPWLEVEFAGDSVKMEAHRQQRAAARGAGAGAGSRRVPSRAGQIIGGEIKCHDPERPTSTL